MDCKAARTSMHAAIDEGVRDAALDQHLAHCAECRAADRELQKLAEALHLLGVDTATIRSQRLEVPAAPRRVRWTTPLRAAAMIALAAGTIWLIAQPWTTQQKIVVEVDPSPHSMPDQGSTAKAEVKPPAGITLQGESSRELMAVAARTSDSGVQMYWLYPKLSRIGSTE